MKRSYKKTGEIGNLLIEQNKYF